MENVSGGTNKVILAAAIIVIICFAGIIYGYFGGFILTDEVITPYGDPPLRIEGDQELIAAAEEHNFTGSGSIEDPYVIENLRIESQGNCIDIRHVTMSIEIKNCSLSIHSWHISAIGIYIRNCSGVNIVDCHAEGGISGIELFQGDACRVTSCTVRDSIFGINATECQETRISDNMLLNNIDGINIGVSNFSQVSSNHIRNSSVGIRTYGSYYGSVIGNNITNCSIGIDIGFRSGNCTISDNQVLDNSEYGIRLDEFTLGVLLYNNKLGWNSISNARDDGVANSWDIEDEIGNYWSDYNGTGWYSIPGTAESVDHYPRIFE